MKKVCVITGGGSGMGLATALLAFFASDKFGCLTAADILCDSGCVACGFNQLKKQTS